MSFVGIDSRREFLFGSYENCYIENINILYVKYNDLFF